MAEAFAVIAVSVAGFGILICVLALVCWAAIALSRG